MSDRSTLLAAHGHAIEAHDALQAISCDARLSDKQRGIAEGMRAASLRHRELRELDEEARNAPR